MRFVILDDERGPFQTKRLGTMKNPADKEKKPVICKTIQLLHAEAPNDIEIIVSSKNKELDLYDCLRYESSHHQYEIDRFEDELVDDNMCFLYGNHNFSVHTWKMFSKRYAGNISVK